MQFVFQLMMKLPIRVTHLKAVRVEGTALLQERFRTFLKKIAKSSSTTVNLCTKSSHVCGMCLIDIILWRVRKTNKEYMLFYEQLDFLG